MEGYGVIYNDQGEKHYDGEFKKGLFDGIGVLYNNLQNRKDTNSEWVSYEGEFKEGNKNGVGKEIYSDRSYYQGQFKDNLKSGFG